MKTRKISMKWAITIAITVVSFICFGLLGFISYKLVGNMMIDEMKENAMGIARVAAGEIDGAVFESIEDYEDDGFVAVYDSLSKYKDSQFLTYIYSMKQTGPEEVVFVVDTDEEEPAELFEEYEWLEDAAPAFAGQVCADTEVSSDEWGSYFSAYAPIMSGNEVAGIVGCDISVDSINEKLAELRGIIIILVIVFDIVCLLTAIIIGSVIGANLKRLYDKATELNSGDKNLLKRIDIRSGDELELIANELNEFLEKVRVLITEVSCVSDMVAGNSGVMNLDVEKCSQAIVNIASTLQIVNEGMQESVRRAEAALMAIDKASHIMEGVHQNSSNNSAMALSISKEVKEQNRLIEDKTKYAEDMAEKLKYQLESAVKNCKQIYEIERLSAQILDVSDKTELLALNASIEAARAGEAGRGFAVIAGDVGELSRQINMLVEQIQNTSSLVIESVEELVDGVNSTTEFIGNEVLPDYADYGKTGKNYSVHMEEMSEVLSKINQELEAMRGSIDVVANEINSINSAIDSAEKNVSDVAEGSIKVADDMKMLTEKAEENNEESKKLKGSISEYTF